MKAPLSIDDGPAFCFWWAVGIAFGTVLALFIVAVTPLTFEGPAPIVGELVGSVVGWEVWWRLRNAGT